MANAHRPLRLPPLVTQSKTRHTCWAAAMWSWLSVTPNSPCDWHIKSQDDLIDQFSMFCNDRGGLNVQLGFLMLAATAGMDYRVFLKGSLLTAGYLVNKLHYKGHLYMFVAGGGTGLPNPLGHAVVIYRVTSPWGKKPMVSAMDPWPGIGYIDRAFSVYGSANEIVVGWSATG